MSDSEVPARRALARVPVLTFGRAGDRRLPDRPAGGEALGVTGAGGSVIVPPTEYDPTTGDDTGELVEVGPGGVVESWAWVAEPHAKHPLDTPFAWALIRLDGADTALLHVVDSGGPDRLATGDRVSVRFRPEAERIGAMADIVAFVPEGGAGR